MGKMKEINSLVDNIIREIALYANEREKLKQTPGYNWDETDEEAYLNSIQRLKMELIEACIKFKR